MNSSDRQHTPDQELESLKRAFDAALPQVARLLPHQGPIEVFIHQNTLHCLESLRFWDALEVGSKIFGAQSAMSEAAALQAFQRGRITKRDLLSCLMEQGEDRTIFPGILLSQLRLALFRAAQPVDRASSIIWLLEEHHAIDEWHTEVGENERRRIIRQTYRHVVRAREKDPHSHAMSYLFRVSERDDSVRIQEHLQRLARLKTWGDKLGFHDFGVPLSLRFLWSTCLELLLDCPQDMLPSVPISESEDRKSRVHHLLIRLSESFLDQGIARWPLPLREQGFFLSALNQLRSEAWARPFWLKDSFGFMDAIQNLSVDEVLPLVLKRLGKKPSEIYDTLLHSALGLRGWAGLFGELERHPELLSGYPAPVPCSLKEFLCIKLLLEYADSISSEQPARSPERPGHSSEDVRCQLALLLYRSAQLLGVSGPQLAGLSKDEKRSLLDELIRWNEVARSKVWHQAFERHLEQETYRTLLAPGTEGENGPSSTTTPRFQVVCCLDDREESFRRYLEEEGEHIETFGAAGFFGVDMEFVPLSSHPAPFCPVQIHPSHRAIEVPLEKYRRRMNSWRLGRKAWMESKKAFSGNSLQSIPGLAVNIGLGFLASVPLVLRILFPRSTYLASKYLRTKLFRPDTLSDVMFTDEQIKSISPESAGFTNDEMATRVSGLMKTLGVAGRYGRLVVVLGHGSFSRNNPMRSAYDCGACGGHPGSINARIFARMANLPEVREELKRRNLEIPAETHFIGGYHNTCTDEVTLFDLELAPPSASDDISTLQEILERVRGKNALERSRRFPILLKKGEYQKAVSYVEWRAQHIGEPRPEFGHATNAICFVGSRSLTRQRFFDRRAFLVSYDKHADQDGSILLGLLSAVVPVCSGINLEYFFSALDNSVYGAGSKLPQNITCLLGVMTGYESDLRTGLPKQMIDIHEPVRLVFIIEAEESLFLSALEKNAQIRQTIENHWVLLSLYDSTTHRLRKYKGAGVFEEWVPDPGAPDTPFATDSESWTNGKTGLLPFAVLKGRRSGSSLPC